MDPRANLLIIASTIAGALVIGCGSSPDEQHAATTEDPLCTVYENSLHFSSCTGGGGGGGGCYQPPLNTSYTCQTGSYFPDSWGNDLAAMGCYGGVTESVNGYMYWNALICPKSSTLDSYVAARGSQYIWEDPNRHDSCLDAAPCGYVWVFWRMPMAMSPGCPSCM